MRAREGTVVAILAACGINPAYDPAATSLAASETGGATTGPPPETGPPPGTDPTADGPTTTEEALATGDGGPTTTDGASTTTSTATGGETTTEGSSTGPPASDCPADDPSLIACYAFAEDPRGEDMLDGSLHGYDGTRAGTTSVASVDGYGAAVKVGPGSDVHVVYYPAFAPHELTFAAFVYIDQDQVDKGLINRDGSYGLYFTDGKVKCRVETDEGDHDVDFAVALDRWYHFACTYDGELLRLHGHAMGPDLTPVEKAVDGNLDDNPGEFVIGRKAGDDSTKLSGWIDQVMVFDRALDPTQVCELAGPLCG